MKTMPDETPTLCAGIPPKILDGLRNYGLHHREPGSFLSAVLANDLIRAVCGADPESLAAIRQIALYVYNALPSQSWGSTQKFVAWLYPPMSPEEMLNDPRR